MEVTMAFVRVPDIPPVALSDGVRLRLMWGQRVMMSFVHFDPDGEVLEHSHPHEQMGTVLEGEFELVIAGETRVVRQGDAYHIPPNVCHSARALRAPAVALDIFSPPREDYQQRALDERRKGEGKAAKDG
jgi:quercetin dioxygenase-like cupin family protein